MPLRYGSRVVGVIVVSKLGLDQFDEDDVRLLEVLAGHAAVAVENARLYESARREAESATSLLEFGRELATLVEPRRHPRARRRADRGYARLAANLVLARGRDGWLAPRKLHGTRRASARESSRAGFDVAEAQELSARRPDPFVLGPADLDADPERRRSSRTPRTRSRRSRSTAASAASSPLFRDDDFGERELRLLGGLAHQAKLAIANASNYEGLERTFVSTVEALANALEANDEYTSPHARWITDLSLRVGEELGLDDVR